MEAQKIVEKAGGPSAVARAVGLSKQAVAQWKQVPARHVLKVAALSGLTPKKIRPDVFDPKGG